LLNQLNKDTENLDNDRFINQLSAHLHGGRDWIGFCNRSIYFTVSTSSSVISLHFRDLNSDGRQNILVIKINLHQIKLRKKAAAFKPTSTCPHTLNIYPYIRSEQYNVNFAT
jgi:hypothetical protein